MILITGKWTRSYPVICEFTLGGELLFNAFSSVSRIILEASLAKCHFTAF